MSLHASTLCKKHADINNLGDNRVTVRTILVLGYWVLGDIHRYWVVLLLGDISVHCDTPIRYRSDSSQHRPQHDNHFDICGAAVVSRGRQGGVECKLYIIIIIDF